MWNTTPNYLIIIFITAAVFSAATLSPDKRRVSGNIDIFLALDPGMERVEIPLPGRGLGGLYRALRRPGSGVISPEDKSQPTEQIVKATRPGNASKEANNIVNQSSQKDEQGITDSSSISNKTIKDENIVIPSPGKNYPSNEKIPDNDNLINYRLLPIPEIPGKELDKKVTNQRNAETSSMHSSLALSDSKGVERDRIPGFPTDLSPTPGQSYRIKAPEMYRGIYINNGVIHSSSRLNPLINSSKKYKINTLVIDIQPRMPSHETMKSLHDKGFYPVARVVVFPGGLNKYPPDPAHIDKILRLSEKAAAIGFAEIQLDYIRFADNLKDKKLTLNKRYKLIAGILKMATDRLRPQGIRVGADVFGRIAFNSDDMIGQKMEVFAEHLDTIYPMLYPSHFYGQPSRIKNPHNTIYDGIQSSVKRVKSRARIIAYIQGFNMKVKQTGLSLESYIYRQIDASEKSNGAGYIVWNASNDYRSFFQAQKLYLENK